MRFKIIYHLIFILFIPANLFSQCEKTGQFLSKNLDEGEAIIWYLYHSGWTIRTKSHFLIFDYCETGEKPANPSLENGFINVKEIHDLNTYVFVTHAHADHYDPIILNWKDSVENIMYIYGWKAMDDTAHFYFGTRREIKKIDVVFTPTFGGEFYTIENLSPRVVFPMHLWRNYFLDTTTSA